MDWLATEPQVFALEVYNEQGWTEEKINGELQRTYTYPYEDDEIRWTAEIVRTIKQRLPHMLVTLSHPGFGITGYDPAKWCKGTGVDFYSGHIYAGISGDSPRFDAATVSAASALMIRAATGIPNFWGEGIVFAGPAPMDLKRFSNRDAIWLNLLGGNPGFFQWLYDFSDEYRWPAVVFRGLPRNFSPERPKVEVEIGEAYREFQDNSRYPGFVPDKFFSPWPMNRQKREDENLQKMFRAYQHSLEIGVPIAFVMGGVKATPLEEFAASDPAKFDHPIRAIGGYQLTYLKDAHNPLWIAYLRKRKVLTYAAPIGDHHIGVPDDAPLELKFDLPKGRYNLRIINLTENREESRRVEANSTLPVSKDTSDDYVLVVSR